MTWIFGAILLWWGTNLVAHLRSGDESVNSLSRLQYVALVMFSAILFGLGGFLIAIY